MFSEDNKTWIVIIIVLLLVVAFVVGAIYVSRSTSLSSISKKSNTQEVEPDMNEELGIEGEGFNAEPFPPLE